MVIMMFTLQILMCGLLGLATSKENIYVDTGDLTFPVIFSGKYALLFFRFFVNRNFRITFRYACLRSNIGFRRKKARLHLQYLLTSYNMNIPMTIGFRITYCSLFFYLCTAIAMHACVLFCDFLQFVWLRKRVAF